MTDARVPLRRRLAVVLTIAASVAFAGHPAIADNGDDGGGGGGKNVVQVNNERDNASKTRSKLAVDGASGPTVANENIALARASCTDCRTVAVAVQAVIVEGPVDDFRPGNAAVAVNELCVRCQTFAYARQEVFQADGHVHLRDEAKDHIQAIGDQMEAVAASDEAFDQMIADLDTLTAELVSVIQGEVDRSGVKADEHSDRKVDRHDQED